MIATRGQYEFGLEVMGLGAMAVLVPVMLEGAAWMLAWQRYQAIAAGVAATRLTVGVWALAGAAAGLNFWHGSTGVGGSVQVGVTYGIASVVGFALVELLARHRAQTTARVRDRRARRRLALARALRFPRVSWAAWSTRIAHGDASDPERAWRQAWASRVADDRDAAPASAEPRVSALVGRPAVSTLAVLTEPRAAAEVVGDAAQAGAATARDEDRPRSGAQPVRSGGPETEEGSAGRGRPGGDGRVRDLADLLRAGSPVTGEQAGVIFGVSERTGRRLVAEAKAQCDRPAPPPDSALPGPSESNHDPEGGAARRLLHFPGSDSAQAGVSA